MTSQQAFAGKTRGGIKLDTSDATLAQMQAAVEAIDRTLAEIKRYLAAGNA